MNNKYHIVRKNGKEAIFDSNDKQISNWWNYIYRFGLIGKFSGYYLVENDERKRAIFHIDDPNNPISKWWDDISLHGLPKGISEYYIVENAKEDKQAIFHKDNPNKPISDWWYVIWPKGLVEGKSDYYVVQNDNGLYAVFHKSGIRMTEWVEKYKIRRIFNIVKNK